MGLRQEASVKWLSKEHFSKFPETSYRRNLIFNLWRSLDPMTISEVTEVHGTILFQKLNIILLA